MGMHRTPSEYDDSEPAVEYRRPPPPDRPAWSPPTPRYTEESWRRVPRPSALPADVTAELQALKAKLAVGTSAVGSDRVLDPEHVRRYLERCAAKKREEAPF
jgi:hypothetical protein